MAGDSKKAQTIRNLWYLDVAQRITAAQTVVAAIRAAIAANNLAGQFTGGELTAMQNVETSLASLAALSGITAAAGKYVPTHQNHALVITGVNDG